jgi:hypothetical protein
MVVAVVTERVFDTMIGKKRPRIGCGGRKPGGVRILGGRTGTKRKRLVSNLTSGTSMARIDGII